MDGIATGSGCITGGICAELYKRDIEEGTGESLGNAETICVPERYRREAIIYLPLKYGLVRFKELCDGTLSIKEFYRAKKEAEFFEWVEEQQIRHTKQKKDEVEYFD